MPDNSSMSWEDAVQWLVQQPGSQELVKACFYDDPLIESATRYWQSSEWGAVRELIPAKPGKALDIGAGRGISSFALAKDGWAVRALEPDPSAVVGAGAIRRLAKEGSVSIDVVEEIGEELPFEPATFDLVHCRQVLHHARDLRQLLRQIARVLRPGGVFIATREHVISRREDLPAFLKSHPLHHLYGGENAYLLQEYTGAIESAGIKLTHVLNPMESDINLYPETRRSMKEQMAKRRHIPFPGLIPDFLLARKGRNSNQPGRLYTFVGRKGD